MSLSNFDILEKLGEGAYSTVFKVVRKSDSKIYALKKVRMVKLTAKEKKNALNEVRILASIRHPNVIRYKEAFFDDESESLCLITEYADSGDLYQKILEHQKKGTYMSEQFIWSVFIQLIKGLKALHDLNILHRDLKSANVFLNTDGSVKLGDMNVSKVAKNGFLYTQTGTPYYASPEVWKDLPYNSKSDIWSLGCVLYEASTLRPPFRAEDMKGLFRKVIKGEYKPLSRVFSRELNMMIGMLMVVDPVKRPTCGKNYVGNLLQMDIVLKRMKVLETMRPESAESRLLDPIKLPKDIAMITNSLPGPDYRNEIRLNHSEPPPPIKRNNSNFSLPKISKEPKNYSQSITSHQSKSSLKSTSTNQSRDYSSQPHSILSASPERTNKHLPKLESEKKLIHSPYYYSQDSSKYQNRSKLASLPESVLPSSYGRNNYLQRIMHIKNTYGLPSVSHNVREYRRVSPSKAGTKLTPIRVIQEEGV